MLCMKNLIFLIFFLIFCSYPVLGDDTAPNTSNWGVQPIPQNKLPIDKTFSPSENIWGNEQDDYIYNNYGSEESPAFLNRENINPNESDPISLNNSFISFLNTGRVMFFE